jgi:hypothetical protein
MLTGQIPYQTFSADGPWVVADSMQHGDTISMGFRVCEVSQNLSTDAHQIAKRLAELMTQDSKQAAEKLAKTVAESVLKERTPCR